MYTRARKPCIDNRNNFYYFNALYYNNTESEPASFNGIIRKMYTRIKYIHTKYIYDNIVVEKYIRVNTFMWTHRFAESIKLNNIYTKGEGKRKRIQVISGAMPFNMFVIRDRQIWRSDLGYGLHAIYSWGDNASSQLLCYPSHYTTDKGCTFRNRGQNGSHERDRGASALISDLAIKIDCDFLPAKRHNQSKNFFCTGFSSLEYFYIFLFIIFRLVLKIFLIFNRPDGRSIIMPSWHK